MIREALFYNQLDGERVHCRLCPADCHLKPGRRGICGSRFNDHGRLKTDNFGETVTVAVDPIEKKPLYHFHPATEILSVGPNGCNLSCRNCQNWEISQEAVRTVYIAPEQLPLVASQHRSIGVSYTYTEPIIWFEYIIETAPLVKQAGLVNVMVTNGYIHPEPLEQLLPLVDAFNVDLKGMRPEFYRRVCRGKLEPVLETIRRVARSRAHLEITNLIIPGLNDSDDDFHRLGQFVASVDPGIPLHLSAYHPSYLLDQPPTPAATLQRGHRIARQYLTYVFVGNMELEGCSHSYCPACGETLIERRWYRVRLTGLKPDGSCAACGADSGVVMPAGGEKAGTA
jgi:pyruvate formate lyase activating enzyme